MDTNELYNTDNAYKLTNIKEVFVQPKNGGGSIRLDGDLYIQKCGSSSYYVLFQKSSSKDGIMNLEEVKQLTNISSDAIITFIYNSKYARIERFYSKNIKLDFVIDTSYDSDYYITGIFIRPSYTNFDLRNYLSNLYMMYSGNNINSYYGMFPVPQPYTCSDLQVDNTKVLMNIDHCECMYDYITDNEDIFIPDIEKVIFNDPATIVFWSDGTKTVVKTQNNETYNKEIGLAMAISKKMLGNTSKYYDTFKKWIK
jgi:hypothetical protein